MKKIILLVGAIICAIISTAQISTTTDTTNVVYIAYNGSNAAITVSSNITSFVTATTNGGNVSIVQSADTTCGEITYELSGESDNGSFYLEGVYKSTVALRGLTLANPTGPAINIQNGKRINMTIKRGTVNTITDGTSTAVDAWKGCYMCKGHTEFKGYGTLNVYGNYAHAIWSKEYIEIKNCTINVYKAVKDAINCNQYFSMESGVVNLSGFGDDGICVSLKKEDTSAENTANFTLIGGTININMKGATGSSIKADGTKTASNAAVLNIYDNTAIPINEAGNGKTVIYNIHGSQIGIFNDRQSALSNLPSGNYISVSGNKAEKIAIP